MQEHHEDRGRFPTWAIAIIAVVIVVAVIVGLVYWYASSSYGYGYPYGYDGYGMMGGFGGIWMIFMWPIGIIVFIAIIYVIYRAVTYGDHNRHYGYYPDEHRMTPFEMLQGRYARGEITKEQFEQMKKDLSY